MEPRDDIPRDIQRAAQQAFRGYKAGYNTGLITGVGHSGQPLADVHTGQPYGHRGNSPVGNELVYLETQAGLIVVTERNALPAGLTEPALGESMGYGAAGGSVLHSAAGDVVTEPKSGQKAKLGSGATKALGLHGDPITRNAALATWMSAVEAGILAAGGGVVAPLVGTTIGTLTASATKAVGE